MHHLSVISTVEKLEVLWLLCKKNWVVFFNLYPVTHIYVMGYSSRSACPCVCYQASVHIFGRYVQSEALVFLVGIVARATINFSLT